MFVFVRGTSKVVSPNLFVNANKLDSREGCATRARSMIHVPTVTVYHSVQYIQGVPKLVSQVIIPLTFDLVDGS